MADDGDDLNQAQRAVVDAPAGATLVVAGAGTGKTRVLTARVARLLERGVAPERILLATFTNRAGEEMVRRVAATAAIDPRRLWAGTFHRVASLVLRQHGHQLGLPPSFTVLDREGARELLAGCIEASPERRLPSPGLLLQVLSLATATGATSEATLLRLAPRFADAAPAVARLADRFQQRKAALAVLDFDDLLVMWKLLLVERPLLAEQLAAGWEHVLVDEYQDASRLQAELMDRAAAVHGNLLVVGDDAQSIYRFRGADPELFADFPCRHRGARVLRLETNYRSTPEILALANRVLAGERRLYEKALRPQRGAGSAPEVVELADVGAQAQFVGARIEAGIAAGRSPTAYAVLYRSHAHSVELQAELVRRRVPYRVRSGPRFLEQAHVRDAVALLRLVIQPRDELAWARLLALLPGVGPAARGRAIAGLVARGPEVLDDATFIRALPAASRGGVRRLVAMIEAVREAGPRPGALLRAILREGYRELVEQRPGDAQGRLDELARIAAWADDYATLPPLLGDLALLGGEGLAPGAEAGPGVTLSTIHQAKGLEWRAVFVLWLADGYFPPAHTRHGSDDEAEERRLLHVAVTRARDDLVLCWPGHATPGVGGRVPLLRSRLLAGV